MPGPKKEELENNQPKSVADEVVELAGATVTVAVEGLAMATGPLKPAAKKAGLVGVGITYVESADEQKKYSDNVVSQMAVAVPVTVVKIVTDLAEAVNTVGAFITKPLPVIGPAMQEIADNDNKVFDSIAGSISESSHGATSFASDAIDSYNQEKIADFARVAREELVKGDFDTAVKKVVNYGGISTREAKKIVAGVQSTIDEKYKEYSQTQREMAEFNREFLKAEQEKVFQKNREEDKKRYMKSTLSTPATVKGPKALKAKTASAESSSKQQPISTTVLHEEPPLDVPLSIEDVNRHISNVVNLGTVNLEGLSLGNFKFTESQWLEAKKEQGLTDSAFVKHLEHLKNYLQMSDTTPMTLGAIWSQTREGSSLGNNLYHYEGDSAESFGSLGFKATKISAESNGASSFFEEEIAVPKFDDSPEGAYIATNAMQGAQILQNFAGQINDPGAKKTMMIVAQSINTGLYAAAAMGSQAALSAVSMSNPYLAAGMFVVSALGLFNTIKGNEQKNNAMTQLIKEIRGVGQMIIDLQEWMGGHFDRQDEYSRSLLDAVEKVNIDLLDHFIYLNHSSTVPILNGLARMDEKSHAKLSELAAKADYVILQELKQIFDTVNFYATGRAPVESMEPSTLINYAARLRGYLLHEVKHPIFTREPNKNHPIRPALLAEDLKQHSQDPISLLYDIGLIVAYMKQIGVLAPEVCPENTLFNVDLWDKTLRNYLDLDNTFSHIEYERDEIAGEISIQGRAYYNILDQLKNDSTWQKLWDEYHQSVEQLKVLFKQTVERSKHKFTARSYNDYLKDFSLKISPLNPNYQDLQIVRTFRLAEEFYKTSWSYLNQALPGYNAHAMQAIEVYDHEGKKMNFRGFRGHHSDNHELRFSTKNPLYLSGQGHAVFSVLANYGLKIPYEFLLAETWGIGAFATTYRFSLLNYKVTFKGRHVTALTINDGWGEAAFGLSVNFHIGHQVYPVFQPKPGYLHSVDAHGSLPIIHSFYNSYMNNYERKVISGDGEWSLLKNNVKQVVLSPANIQQTLTTVRNRNLEFYQTALKKLSLEVNTALTQSPQMARKEAAEQLLVAYATWVGFPEEGIKNLSNLLTTQDVLALVKLGATGQAPWDHHIALNLPNEEDLKSLKEKMNKVPLHGSLTEHYLREGLKAIEVRKLKVHVQKLAQKKTRSQLIQETAIEQQFVLQNSIEKCSDMLMPLHILQQQLPSAISIPELSEALTAIKEQYHELDHYFTYDELEEKTNHEQTKPEVVISPERVYEEELQNLCSSSKSSLISIQERLQQLKKEGTLEAVLNIDSLETRPLNLAIKAGRKDVVALLLRQENVIIDDYSFNLARKYPNPEIGLQMAVTLDFHKAMSIDPKIGRTLNLTAELLSILPEPNTSKPAVVMYGRTGVGKSSFVSLFADPNLHYEQSLVNGKPALKGSVPGIAKTSASFRSETIYPQIIHFEDFDLVDTAGTTDVRSFEHNFIGGFTPSILGRSFPLMRALVVLVDAHDIYGGRNKEFDEFLRMLGNAIGSNSELLSNVILVVNKASAQQVALGAQNLKTLFEFYLEDNEYLDKNTKFLLSNISADQIMVVDIPTQTVRTALLSRINKLENRPYAHFDFSHSHREVEDFKNLIAQIQSYHAMHCDYLLSLNNGLGHSLEHLIAEVQAVLKTMASEELEDQRADGLMPVIKAQRNIKNMLESFIQKVTDYALINLNKKGRDTVVFKPQHIEELQQRAFAVQLVAEFLGQLAPVAKELNINLSSECSYLPKTEFLTPNSRHLNAQSSADNLSSRPNYQAQNNAGLDFNRQTMGMEFSSEQGSFLAEIASFPQRKFTELRDGFFAKPSSGMSQLATPQISAASKKSSDQPMQEEITLCEQIFGTPTIITERPNILPSETNLIEQQLKSADTSPKSYAISWRISAFFNQVSTWIASPLSTLGDGNASNNANSTSLRP
jgi:hypothetical protein